MVILRKYETCFSIETSRRLRDLDLEILETDKAIAGLRWMCSNTTSSIAERLFFSIEELEAGKADLYHKKLLTAYPKADAIYEDRIVYLCGEEALCQMKTTGLIECCGNISGRKLYAI